MAKISTTLGKIGSKPHGKVSPVQGNVYNNQGNNNDTELARSVAKQKGWGIDEEDQIISPGGTVIAKNIAEAAEKMSQKGWIIPGSGISWRNIPDDGQDAADALNI